MTPLAYHLVALALAAGMVWGIHWMNSPRTAVRGNLLGSLCMLGAIVLTLIRHGVLARGDLWLAMVVGGAAGSVLAAAVSMVQMPQLVALLNGLGGGASALVAWVILGGNADTLDAVTRSGAGLALAVGAVTLSGSAVAAGKLHGKINGRPIILPGHMLWSVLSLAVMVLGVAGILAAPADAGLLSVLTLLAALGFGVLFAIRIGGADMPITISLLNSLSGLAASIAGFALRNPLLVVAGAVVGAAGLVLTEHMCRAMNRALGGVLLGRLGAGGAVQAGEAPAAASPARGAAQAASPSSLLKKAELVIIVPGYGMALAQAQHEVANLMQQMEADGAKVCFAIHPVAGRMPGHMNVLLAEAGVPYDKLCEMDAINPKFKNADVVIVVGANDVVNPAAATAEDTPIYGMPILRVSDAKHVMVCNKDTEPGYAGVENPLYSYDNVTLLLGDAKDTVARLARESHRAP